MIRRAAPSSGASMTQMPVFHPAERRARQDQDAVGEETLNRFYILHCVAIPLLAAFLMSVHFWRVRKDGGISGPL